MNWHGLATYELHGRTAAGVIVAEKLYDLHDSVYTTKELLNTFDWKAFAERSVADMLGDWPRFGPQVAALAAAIGRSPGIAPVPAGYRYLVPYTPRRIFGVASNFYDHAEEMGTRLAERAESQPYCFMKAETSVLADQGVVLMPPETTQLDWEVELGVIIAAPCRHVGVAQALDHVAAYTVFNDISARDLNKRTDYPFKQDWFRGKSFDTFGPIGPWVVPAACVPDPQNLKLRLSVNDELMQDGNTSQMIFSIAEQIAYLSRILTLMPGDLIASGTPDGVGMGRGVFLKPGDRMVAEIEHVGRLRNTVAAETLPAPR